MKDEIKEILKEIYNIQVRYSKPMLKRNYTDKDYTIESYENLVFKMKNYITNLEEKYVCMYDKLTSESTEWESKCYKLQEENEKALDKLYCYGEIFDTKILQQFQKEMLYILKGEENENK